MPLAPQGIATLAGRTETAEGLDTKLVIHYFGRVAFIQVNPALTPLLSSRSAARCRARCRMSAAPAESTLSARLRPAQALLPQLSAARGRVLSVLSAGVHGTYAHYADDFELRQHYSLKNAADAAGLYNDAALHSLALETPGVAFCHAAPGIVRTRWGSEMPTAVRVTVRALMACLGKPPAAAADALVPALLRAPPGFSLIGPSGQPARRTATHDEMRPVVWSQTLALLRRIQ